MVVYDIFSLAFVLDGIPKTLEWPPWWCQICHLSQLPQKGVESILLHQSLPTLDSIGHGVMHKRDAQTALD